MKLNAINAVNSVINCQPLKNVDFGKKQAKEASYEQFPQMDVVVLEHTPAALESKYDLACRLAAFYKTQYEQLLNEGSVVA
jgi:hypothetical protein